MRIVSRHAPQRRRARANPDIVVGSEWRRPQGGAVVTVRGSNGTAVKFAPVGGAATILGRDAFLALYEPHGAAEPTISDARADLIRLNERRADEARERGDELAIARRNGITIGATDR